MPKKPTTYTKEGLLERFVPVLLVLTIVLAFVVGILWSKVSSIEKGTASGEGSAAVNIQKALSKDSFLVYARELKLDKDQFESCLEERKYQADVEKDVTEANENGVGGTPGFFLNGHFISGAQPFSLFRDAIDFELAGGDWAKPDETVAYLVDGDVKNGEIGREIVEVGLGSSPSKGDENAPVTLIEYADFQCPYCARHFEQTHPQILSEYVNTGRVRLVYKQLPLVTIHPLAQGAAEASLCAHEQGMFWEFHDKVFDAVNAR